MADPNIELDLDMKIFLKIKSYIFLEKNCYFLDGYKIY
jgi:hypothetical protein